MRDNMNSCYAFLSNKDGFTVFKYGNYVIRFKAPYSLEKYMQEILDYIDYLEKENQELKERLERIDNYLDKYYTVENQYWFDHIRDIVEDR